MAHVYWGIVTIVVLWNSILKTKIHPVYVRKSDWLLLIIKLKKEKNLSRVCEFSEWMYRRRRRIRRKSWWRRKRKKNGSLPGECTAHLNFECPGVSILRRSPGCVSSLVFLLFFSPPIEITKRRRRTIVLRVYINIKLFSTRNNGTGA